MLQLKKGLLSCHAPPHAYRWGTLAPGGLRMGWVEGSSFTPLQPRFHVGAASKGLLPPLSQLAPATPNSLLPGLIPSTPFYSSSFWPLPLAGPTSTQNHPHPQNPPFPGLGLVLLHCCEPKRCDHHLRQPPFQGSWACHCSTTNHRHLLRPRASCHFVASYRRLPPQHLRGSRACRCSQLQVGPGGFEGVAVWAARAAAEVTPWALAAPAGRLPPAIALSSPGPASRMGHCLKVW